jgi:hypothetical protein
MPRRCPTCPFRPGSPYEALAEELAKGALSTGSRICHSTGRNSLKGNTGKPSKLCRGARNLQLEVFAASGFIEAATDAAWQKKRDELGI